MAIDPDRRGLDADARHRRNWLPFLLAALVAILVLVVLTRSCAGDRAADNLAVDDAAVTAPVATPVPYVTGGLAAYLAGNEPLPYTYELARVTFDTGSAALSDDAKAEIDDIAAALKTRPSARVSLRGYADPAGDAAANQSLSQQRAEAVRAALIQAGAVEGQVELTALGETGEAAIAQNRRVEMSVTAR